MRRTRIEMLEARKMFSVTDLIIDPFTAVSAIVQGIKIGTANGDLPLVDQSRTESVGKNESISIGQNRAASVAAGDFNGDNLLIGTDGGIWKNRISHTYDSDLDVFAAAVVPSALSGRAAIPFMALPELDVATNQAEASSSEQVVGDFNGDGRDDLAGWNNLIIVVCSRVPVDGMLLPYVEQENLYNFHHGARIDNIADGTSNTLSLAETDRFVVPVQVDLLGLHVNTSPIDVSLMGVDVWEHAYRVSDASGVFGPEVGKPDSNGIIAILIGLSVDPSDPSGNTYSGLSFCFADGSVHFIRVDTSNIWHAVGSIGSPDYGALGVTHDVEFEAWAGGSRSARGYMKVELSDVLVSSIHGGRGNAFESAAVSNPVVGSDHAWGNAVLGILHEDNEFSFPRMIR